MLLFDLKSLQSKGSTMCHGGGKYAEIVFFRLVESGEKFVCAYDSRCWTAENIIDTCHDKNIPLIDLKDNSWNKIISENDISRLYSAVPDDEILQISQCEVVVTLHGLRALETPFSLHALRYDEGWLTTLKYIVKYAFFQKYYYRKALAFYKHYFSNPRLRYVVVSNHTRNAIGVYYPEVDMNKIKVFYSPSTSAPTTRKRTEGVEPYFLMVSGNRFLKNCLRGIMAIDRLLSIGRLPTEYKVKVTGVKDARHFRYTIRNPKNFEFLGYVSEEELDQLYTDAYALIYPSLSEGFGYPPMEAMRYGIPVIASPFTSISEVCGGAAMYCNPYSVEELMNRILQTLDSHQYQRMAEEGRKRYAEITVRQNADLDKLINFILRG